MKYIEYRGDKITASLLHSIKFGDTVRCNDWKRGMKVKGVSNYHVLMSTSMFGKTLYSICDKTPTKYGTFYIGTDNLIFGHSCEYKFDDDDAVEWYLNDLESGIIGLSRRTEMILTSIAIKK